MEDITYYIFCAASVIIGIWLLKRFVGCLIRTIIVLAVLAFIGYIYFMYLM